MRPIVELNDKNVFAIIGKSMVTLQKHGEPKQAIELKNRAFAADSYKEVLQIVQEYVELNQ